MKIYKSKIMKIINFIKNEGKIEFGDMVKIRELKKEINNDIICNRIKFRICSMFNNIQYI